MGDWNCLDCIWWQLREIGKDVSESRGICHAPVSKAIELSGAIEQKHRLVCSGCIASDCPSFKDYYTGSEV